MSMLGPILSRAAMVLGACFVVALLIDQFGGDFAVPAKRPEGTIRRPVTVARAAPAAARAALNEIELRAGPRGHFLVEASVEGTSVDFVVDTGATMVVLRREDAEELGLRPDDLTYTRKLNTANGVAAGAPVTLREVRIGQLTVRDVDAMVISGQLGMSLLGNSFLRRLEGYEVVDDRLILRF
jgi:aspartyl protease family protein